ncbi:MAG: hypothetical protein LBU08_03500, partial [Tannerellaceae bacterium]|nr:hypothetical protein [Tannerellaceae bacterium]
MTTSSTDTITSPRAETPATAAYSAFLDRISQDLLLSLPTFEDNLLSLPPEPLVQAFLQSTRTLTKNNSTPPPATREEDPRLGDSLARTFPDFWNSLFELPPYQLVLYYLQAARIPPLLSPDSPLLPLFSSSLSDYYPYFLNTFNSLPPHHYLFFHSQLLRLTTPKPQRPPGRPKKNNPSPPPATR